MTAYNIVVTRAGQDPDFDPDGWQEENDITDITCGKCGSDAVAEKDITVEWRPITVTDTGVMIGEDRNPQPEGDGFICMACTTELVLREEDEDLILNAEYW